MFKRVVSLFLILLLSSPSYAYTFKFKGSIKPEVLISNKAVASYGSAYSQVAPTNALRTDVFEGGDATPQQTSFLESEATSFQAAQSRFSLHMSHQKVRTVLEFDFIDGEDGFTNQTAIQAQEPRLRLATLFYDLNEHVTLFGGQKWTTAAGIKSFGTYNWIGNAFRAGNTGFLAMEAGATYKNAGWSITGALTGKGRNATAAGINSNELGSRPGIAVDVNYSFSGGHKIGFAGHVAQIKYEDEPDFVSGEDQDAELYKVYSTLKFGQVTVFGEFYAGQSINNLNSLGIAPASRLSNGVVREAFEESGFFTYASWDAAPKHNIRVGYASASVDSGDRDRLSRTDLLKNTTAYVNYNYQIQEGLKAFIEVTNFDSEYGVDNADFSASVGRAGVWFTF